MLHMVMAEKKNIESLDQLGLGPVNPLLQVPQFKLFKVVSFERICHFFVFGVGNLRAKTEKHLILSKGLKKIYIF